MTADGLATDGLTGESPAAAGPVDAGLAAAGPVDAGLLDAVIARFAADEMATCRRPGSPDRLQVAAVGTLAEASVDSPLLDAACQAAGIRIGGRTARADLGGLLADPDWDLALVLSPFKSHAARWCDRLAPRAAATGVVDTLVRAGGEVAGYNTNSHAWAAAAAQLMGTDVPARILVVGSGATARSVTFGALRAFPGARVGVAARSRVFDLTNRLSALQAQAPAAGCVVMSGNLMQLLTNTLRAALARTR
jgi:shikimate dehydrogenase